MVRFLRLAISFSPASVTLVFAEVKARQVLEVGDFLHPRIRHMGVAEVKAGQVFEVGDFLQPRIRHLGSVKDKVASGF